MSISKIINQVKQGYSTVPVSTKSNSATAINLDSSNLSKSISSDVSPTTTASGNNNTNNGSVTITKHSQLLSKYQEKTDDWNDMEDISTKVSAAASTAINVPKKEELDTDKTTVTNEEDMEEEDWDDIEVPSSGTLNLHSSNVNNKDNILSKYQEESEEELLESEEDWEGVSVVPSKYHHSENTKVAAISKSSLNEDDEDWSGLEIPTTLQLKVPVSPMDQHVEESIKEEDNNDNGEEDWDDVEIPDNFASKLQSKKPSTPVHSF